MNRKATLTRTLVVALVGLALIATALVPSPAGAQDVQWLGATARLSLASHPAGLETMSGDEVLWRHRLEPAGAVGITLWMGDAYGVRVDADRVWRARLRAGSTGPQFWENESGSMAWTTFSAWVRPAFLCGAVCPRISAGWGGGTYDLRAHELHDDIMMGFAPRQTVEVWRLGLDLAAPRLARRVTLQVADYIGTIERERTLSRPLSPMHVLLVGLAIGY